MKKYLLLLVFAISTATCFALPSRPVASVQKASEESPYDEAIGKMLNELQNDYEQFQSVYYAMEYRIEESGDTYFRDVIADRLGYAAEAKELLEKYYPDGKYIGGISTEEECNEFCRHIAYLIDEILATEYLLRDGVEEHIAMYQELFVPFKTSYDESLNALKECETKIRDMFLTGGSGYKSRGFKSALKALNSTFETLFSDTEQAMCDMSVTKRIDEFNERLAEANACVERLIKIGDVTYREQNAFVDSRKILESECTEVYYYYGYSKEFWSIDDEFEDAFYANGSMNDIIYNQEHTDIYITTVEKLIEEISNFVSLAKEAQKRYDDCQAAMEDAQKALEAAWATIESDCPDVYNNYKSAFDGLSGELDGIGRGLSSAFQSQEATDSFMNSLNDLAKRAGEVVDKAKNEQKGTTGVAGVEAAGNDDAEYYDLTGAKVTNPRPGTIVIKVDASGKTTKVVVR